MKNLVLIFLILKTTLSFAQAHTISKLDSIKVVDNSEIVSFKDVQMPPILKACEKLVDVKALSNCLSDNINKIIGINFNPSIIKKQKLQGKIIKIITKFTIDSHGDIVNIVIDHENQALRNEIIRVIGLIPKMTPALLNNNSVNVEYIVPMAFSNNY